MNLFLTILLGIVYAVATVIMFIASIIIIMLMLLAVAVVIEGKSMDGY